MKTIILAVLFVGFVTIALAVTPTPTASPNAFGQIPAGTDVVTYAGWHIVNGKLVVVPVATPTATATATATATSTSTPTPTAP